MTAGYNHKRYTVKRIGPDNISDMDKLYSVVYGHTTDPGYFPEKFLTDYTGIEYTGLITYNEEAKPVASLCLVPCYILYEGKSILSAQLTDGMTDPSERRNGLFERLTNEIITLAKEKGIQLLIGFPNQTTAPLLIKMGWIQAGSMDRFVIPVYNPVRLLMIKLMNRIKKPKQKKIPADIVFTGCNNSVLKDGFAGIDREGEYLLYKTFTDTRIQREGNAKAWIKIGHDLAIGDMEVTKDEFMDMINALRVLAKKAGTPHMFFQSSPGTSLYTLFSQHYKPIPSFPVVFKNLGPDLSLEKIKFTFADIDIF